MPAIKFQQGDVRNFDFPQENFDFIIHAAADASAKLNEENPLLMIDTIVEGTRRVLDFTRQCGAKRFLLISSGAVYGIQPSEISHIAEDYIGAPDVNIPTSAYAEGKRLAELLSCVYHQKYGIETVIARCFAFVGPYLDLDIHYAVGNFIRDGLKGQDINIFGDGTPYRSYLYAADLAIWLWTILLKGKSGRAYNVGSDEEICIAELAKRVSSHFKQKPKIKVAKKPKLETKPARYVPSTKRAEKELGLCCWVNLDEGIRRTIKFYSKNYD